MKNLKLLPCVFLFAFMFSSSVFAYHISGSVLCDTNEDGLIDENDTPLGGVKIVAVSASYGTFFGSTDENGLYMIDLAPQGGFADFYDVSIDPSTLGPLANVIIPDTISHNVDLVNNFFFDGINFLINDPECRETQSTCGDGIWDTDEQCDDGNIIDGDGCSSSCTIELGGQGCTPGYWKQEQHADSWMGYTPNMQFSAVFENAFPGKTLLDVLMLHGGGLNALGRHTVAALLNTASDSVYFDMSTAGVVNSFNSVYPGSKQQYNSSKGVFEDLNELGCPLN